MAASRNADLQPARFAHAQYHPPTPPQPRVTAAAVCWNHRTRYHRAIGQPHVLAPVSPDALHTIHRGARHAELTTRSPVPIASHARAQPSHASAGLCIATCRGRLPRALSAFISAEARCVARATRNRSLRRTVMAANRGSADDIAPHVYPAVDRDPGGRATSRRPLHIERAAATN